MENNEYKDVHFEIKEILISNKPSAEIIELINDYHENDVATSTLHPSDSKRSHCPF